MAAPAPGELHEDLLGWRALWQGSRQPTPGRETLDADRSKLDGAAR
ncbi:MAG: hypothetical protein ACE5IL_08920 [Myxococcota bacterium]